MAYLLAVRCRAATANVLFLYRETFNTIATAECNRAHLIFFLFIAVHFAAENEFAQTRTTFSLVERHFWHCSFDLIYPFGQMTCIFSTIYACKRNARIFFPPFNETRNKICIKTDPKREKTIEIQSKWSNQSGMPSRWKIILPKMPKPKKFSHSRIVL